MKYLLAILSLAIVVSANPPLDRDRPRPADAYRDPFRKYKNRYWDLRPLARGEAIGEWHNLALLVKQANVEGGIRAYVFSGVQGTHPAAPSGYIFLRHYPSENLTDGDTIYVIAHRDGTKTYSSIGRGTVTIPAYNYGEPYDPRKKEARP